MKHIASSTARIIAHVCEMALLLLVVQLLALYVLQGSDISGMLDRLLVAILVWFVYGFFYGVILNVYLTASLGGTVGKLLTGIHIVDADGKHVSLWQAFVRNLIGYMVSGTLLSVGFIWILVDKQRRAWHDMIADTYVVVRDPQGMFIGTGALVLLIGLNVWLGMRNYQQYVQRQPTIVSAVQTATQEARTLLEESNREATPASSQKTDL